MKKKTFFVIVVSSLFLSIWTQPLFSYSGTTEFSADFGIGGLIEQIFSPIDIQDLPQNATITDLRYRHKWRAECNNVTSITYDSQRNPLTGFVSYSLFLSHAGSTDFMAGSLPVLYNRLLSGFSCRFLFEDSGSLQNFNGTPVNGTYRFAPGFYGDFRNVNEIIITITYDVPDIPPGSGGSGGSGGSAGGGTGGMPGNQDSDNDGLTDAQEQNLGTNPQLADTDQDGLSDGDESNHYHTDPLDMDTDDDAFNDAEEVAIGLNPLASDNPVPIIINMYL